MDWDAAAKRFGEGIDWSRIPSRVVRRLTEAHPLYVACSGGADSVFALLLARRFLEMRGLVGRLRALHFDHALRGEDSSGDARFVAAICEALGIEFLDAKAKWNIPVESVTELRAREARFGFFRDATGASEGDPRWIVTGHHADDVTETLLMRLSRGSGADGLCVPREVSTAGGGIRFLRPILEFSREEIRGGLRSAGVPWREDVTNDSDRNYRARLRRNVIPAWEQAADRELRKGALRSRALLEEDASALEAWAEAAWREAWSEERQGLAREAVERLPRAVRRRLLLRLEGVAEARAAVVDGLLSALEEGEEETFSVSARKAVRLKTAWIASEEARPAEAAEWSGFRLPEGCVAYLPDGSRVAWRRILKAAEEGIADQIAANDDSRSAWLSDDGNLCRSLEVRRRRTGDAFKPMGKSSDKKLKELLIERKIPKEQRGRLPVFVSPRGGIVWMPGLPPASGRKLGTDAESALRLTYDR